MGILINRQTRVMVQGITGYQGSFHTQKMIEYGTNVVAGITPGRGGEWVMENKVPVFESVRVAKEATGADASVIFVPARFATDAILEAIDAQVGLIVCITDGIPTQDMMRICSYLKDKNCRLIGPNCPGILTPGEAKMGIIPGNIALAGNVGVVSRSGTLTYEVLFALKRFGLGVSSCVGIGGDPILGTGFVDVLELFEADPHTDQVVLIGEIGGNEEEVAADFIASRMTKPVVAFIAGKTAPADKRMGHAGAIIEGDRGLATEKIRSLENAGVKVVDHPEEIPLLIRG
ncbi:MAG: succinate--CoA ligase subunit alpha [Chloroflexi bacterium]|nr:succinate--CoA ligase subunit alpha [Chloroflexota bacterium]